MKRTPPPTTKFSPEQVSKIEAAAFALVEQAIGSDFYLLGVDFDREQGYIFLRVYAEKADTAAALISLSDCEWISRTIDPLLEALPELRDIRYNLEVSSPGLFRPLKTAREFAFYADRRVRIETVASVKKTKGPPAKKELQPPAPQGVLKGFDAGTGSASILLDGADKPIDVPVDDKTLICLNPEIKIPDEDEDA